MTSAAPIRRLRPPWSLALRLTVWHSSWAFLMLAGCALAAYNILVQSLAVEDDHYLAEKVEMFVTVLRDRPGDREALEMELRETQVRIHEPVYVRILDAGGSVSANTPGIDAVLPPSVFPTPRPFPENDVAGIEVDSGDREMRIAAARLTAPGLEGTVVQVGLDRSLEVRLLASFRRALIILLAIGLVLSFAGGHAVARRSLRPIREISAHLGHIGSSNLGERLDPAHLPAELSSLASMFNSMFARLQDAFDRISRFSADIAHELRTPLQNLRVQAEVALGKARSESEYRAVLESSLEEFERLSQLIGNLLFLARAADPGLVIVRRRVDLAVELSTVVELYRPLAEEEGIALELDVPPGLAADVERTLFQRAVGNLIENALAYTPAGGVVRVAARSEGGESRVEVSDTGPGIAPEFLPHVFDRFVRADPSRSKTTGGVGLGLSIVQSIAGIHGGRVELESRVGEGTCVSILFPAAVAARSAVEAQPGR